ncbi:MAG: damage-inducible protein [Bacillales bacterium]|jgi:nicotinamide-nucleotide amidase|nr:damage-inducible protein [Bacillales bacterium]
MNAEIIAVGSELLLGQIVNTNARFLSQKLAEMGISIFFHTVVGDNPGRLLSAVKIAESRADIIIFTGGLGPTKDDLTKETVAEYLTCKLVYSNEALKSIEDYFKRVNRLMTENNKKQATVFEGSTVFTNKYGMAPGFAYRNTSKTYIFLPGPPSEMEPMVIESVIPYLNHLLESKGKIVSRVLRFFGIGEAELETRILDLLEGQTNPTIAPLANDGEVTLRLTANGSDDDFLKSLLDKTEQQIQNRLGNFFYGYNQTTLLEKVFLTLKEKNLTISAAESLTGGLFQQEITSIPGASNIFKGGVVTYSNEAKITILDVREATIMAHGVVSNECAIEMADCVREKFGTDIGISFTGVAGPEELEGKPVGTVYVGISILGKESIAIHLTLGNNRDLNRIRSVKNAYHLLIQQLK